jgi:hypothetical protein
MCMFVSHSSLTYHRFQDLNTVIFIRFVKDELPAATVIFHQTHLIPEEFLGLRSSLGKFLLHS